MASTTSLTSRSRARSLPPLWLAAAATASAWAAVFSVLRWIATFRRDPADLDFRAYYYAARLGIEEGWSRIYDQQALQALISRHLSGADAIVNSSHTFPNPPLLAWIVAHFALLPYPAAYAAWTVAGLLALVFAWRVASPVHGLAGVTLLLIAIAIWPVHYSLLLGQPVPEILALLAVAWWLLKRDRPVAAGIALGVATALKPQDLILVPFALLIAGRPRVFVACAATCAAFAVAFIASLGAQGLSQFWQTTVEVEGDPWHHYWTLAFVAGAGPRAYALEAAAALASLAVAWRKRSSLELVIAVALLGSVLSAVHEHETDAAMLVMAAWLVLGSVSGQPVRLWLLLGIVAAQTMSIGLVWPIFAWGFGWLLLLALDKPAERVGSPGRVLQLSPAQPHQQQDVLAELTD